MKKDLKERILGLAERVGNLHSNLMILEKDLLPVIGLEIDRKDKGINRILNNSKIQFQLGTFALEDVILGLRDLLSKMVDKLKKLIEKIPEEEFIGLKKDMEAIDSSNIHGLFYYKNQRTGMELAQNK